MGESLNLLMLAPGGHVGRLCVWSKSAFESLEGRYPGKDLPKTLMKNDLNSLINSDEIQQAINAKKSMKKVPRKRNLLSRRAGSRLSEAFLWRKSLQGNAKQKAWMEKPERNSVKLRFGVETLSFFQAFFLSARPGTCFVLNYCLAFYCT